jgi:hypothetical protein
MVINARRVSISAVAYEGEWGEVDSFEDLKSYSVPPFTKDND